MKLFVFLNTKIVRLFLVAFIPSFLLIGPSLLAAQGLPGSVGGLSLSVSSDNPTPGTSVTITAQSYSTDINAARLTWTADGKSLGTGYGLTQQTVQAPAAGKHLTVSVTMEATDGTTLKGSAVI